MKRVVAGLLAAALCLIGEPVLAGQSCEERPADPEQLRKAFALAVKVRDVLDASGAGVALIARVGQDLSKYRLRYSHAAFAWRDDPAGRWRLLHLLNECGTAESTLYRQGLANFFADDMVAWEALVVVPSATTQERLAGRFASGAAAALHGSRYNMLAYPFASVYQNSNQWIAEVLAEALADTAFLSRSESTTWLRANGFRPTTLEIPALTRLGARMFRANVAFDDHPTERRMAGQIDTTTVDAVVAFVDAREGPVVRRVVRLP